MPSTFDHGGNNMYLLTKWKGRMEKYLAHGHGVWTLLCSVRAP